MNVFNPSKGGAESPHPEFNPRAVPAPAVLPEPAELSKGPVQSTLQAPGYERRQPVPPSFCPTAASAQRQREGAGGLVRAANDGPAEEEADWGGCPEKEQGAGRGPKGQTGAPKRGLAETGVAEHLS